MNEVCDYMNDIKLQPLSQRAYGKNDSEQRQGLDDSMQGWRSGTRTSSMERLDRWIAVKIMSEWENLHLCCALNYLAIWPIQFIKHGGSMLIS